MYSRLHLPEFKLSAAVLLVIASMFFQGCQKSTVIPAIAIEGTYTSTTRMPVYFASQSDSCSHIYGFYDSTGVVMSWQITHTTDNLVDVIISATSMDTTRQVFTDCNLASQYAFPMKLHGVVGGTDLIVERSYIYYDTVSKPRTAYYQLGDFKVKDNILTGSLVDLQCDTLHCYGYRTLPFSVKKN